MIIQITDTDEFRRLLDALISDLVDAAIHAKLQKGLSDLVPNYHREFAQSNTFWSLTFRAHADASIFRLCRAFDQDAKAVNLRNLLDTIKSNLWVFEEVEFRKRLAGNPFVDALAALPRKPDPGQLDQDIELVSSATNPLVKKLMLWRNNLYAHRSPRLALDAASLQQQYPLTYDDLDSLLALGLEIVNRYSHLFQAAVHSTTIIGHDDYKSLLTAVRCRVEAYDAEIERQRRQAEEGRVWEWTPTGAWAYFRRKWWRLRVRLLSLASRKRS